MAEIEYVSKEVFEATLQRFYDEDNRQNHRISQIEAGLMKLTNMGTSVEKLAVNMENMCKVQQSMDGRLTNLEAKPAKRWEQVVTNIITTVVGLALGFLAAKIGLSS